MAAPNQITEHENPSPSTGVSLDPFAVDFFGGEPLRRDKSDLTLEGEPPAGKRAEMRKKSNWYKNLPRISNREAEFSNLLTNLPENLSESAARIFVRTLARYTFQPSESVECEIVSVAEVNLNRAAREQNESSKILLSVAGQIGNARAIVALNVDLASVLIDSMLDGQSAATANRRDLSPVETTIIEFLAANVLSEINDFLGEKTLILEGVKAQTTDLFETFERGAEIVFKISCGKARGNLSLFAPQRFLKALEKPENSLFTGKNGAKNPSDFEKFAGMPNLRLQIGTTRLPASSLLYLEPGDIVLIERLLVALENGIFGGNLQVFVGRGRNFSLRGTAANEKPAGGLQLRIEEILSEETRRKFTPARIKMDISENDLAEEKNLGNDLPGAGNGAENEDESASLENIQVALRVEIAGDKISLRELQNLRAGQIIGLGVSPNDPVRLVTDNAEEPVAAGELVEIEGQLGVRLTKVFI